MNNSTLDNGSKGCVLGACGFIAITGSIAGIWILGMLVILWFLFVYSIGMAAVENPGAADVAANHQQIEFLKSLLVLWPIVCLGIEIVAASLLLVMNRQIHQNIS